MGKKYLIDTNVLIDAQARKLPADALIALGEIIDRDFTISFITFIEYLGFKDISKSAEVFIRLANVIEIDKEIIEICVKLRKISTIKLPDAIIAATALSRGLTIVTRNTSDFAHIIGLDLINPWEKEFLN